MKSCWSAKNGNLNMWTLDQGSLFRILEVIVVKTFYEVVGTNLMYYVNRYSLSKHYRGQ